MKNLVFLILAFIIFLPLVSYGQAQPGFEPFQRIPGLERAGELSTQQYINALYTIAIVAASILAVFKLIWAGVQYMLSEVVTKKENAKRDIRGALLGLVIILGAVTILNTINPTLTNLNFLRNANQTQPIKASPSGIVQPPPVVNPPPTEAECSNGETRECRATDETDIPKCECVSNN